MKAEIEVRHAQNEADLRWMYQIEQEEYGTDSIASFEKIQAWWTRFPQGTFRMLHKGERLGGIGIWPLEESAFLSLTSGNLDEHEMEETHIAQKQDGQQYPYWYVGDIILKKDYRRKRQKWAVQLLIEVLKKWLQSGNLAPQIKICALVYSPQGRSLAERLKFQECAKTPNGYSVFVRQTSIELIQSDLENLSDRFNI